MRIKRCDLILILNSSQIAKKSWFGKHALGIKETSASKTAFEESARAMILTHCSSSLSYLPPPHHHHRHCHYHPKLCTNGASTGLGNSGKPTAPAGQPTASNDESTAPKNVLSKHYWSPGQPILRGRRATNLALIRRYECGQCLQAQGGLLLLGLEQRPGRGLQQGAGWQELSYQGAPFHILNSTLKGVIFLVRLKSIKS